jgi:hypothetical protein
MSEDDMAICKAVVDMDSNILGAGIIENLELAAMHARPDVPLPKQEKFSLMFSQSEIMISIAKTNADFFGPFRYIVSSFQNSDIMFFPLNTGKKIGDRILATQVMRPCDHEAIAGQVKQLISVD